jgi:hypothetical protein
VTVTGTVINVHYHGATVRLVDGTLAAVPAAELAAHRSTYVAGCDRRTPLELVVDRSGRHLVVLLPQHLTPPAAAQTAPPAAPRLIDPAFERRLGEYLKATQEWAPADRPEPAERHFIRKKRRAAFFEARNKPT